MKNRQGVRGVPNPPPTVDLESKLAIFRKFPNCETRKWLSLREVGYMSLRNVLALMLPSFYANRIHILEEIDD